MKQLLVFLIVLGFVNHTQAQDRKISTLTTIGITSPILDNGIGFHVGLHPYLELTDRLSAEGQISYMYTKIGSFFLVGTNGSVNSVNTLAGGRLYLSSKDKNTRFFLNLLAGLNYSIIEENGVTRAGEFNIGYSGGLFMDLSRITIGLTYETPQNLILKLGYSF